MVSITIVTWNSAQHLGECFAAIEHLDYRDLEVIIVDNASTDGTHAILQTAEAKWPVIYNTENVGFAEGQNQAIRASQGEWVLCLNPDVVLSSNFVTQLVWAGEAHPEAGSLCGKLLRWDSETHGSYQGTTSVVPKGLQKDEGFSPCTNLPQGLKAISSIGDTAELKPCPDTKPMGDMGRDLHFDAAALRVGPPEMNPEADPRRTNIIDSTGIFFTRNMRHLDRGAEEVDRGQYDRPQYVFGATGAAAFFRRKFIDDLSIEGEFFAFREDADLAWRAQLMGWKCLYAPHAVAWHVRRVTPERRRNLPLLINWHSIKNRFLMRGKNASGWLCRRLFFPVLWRDLMIVGYAALRDRRLWSALTYCWHVRKDTRRKRAIVQSRRRVSDRDLLWWFSDTPRAMEVASGKQSALSSQP